MERYDNAADAIVHFEGARCQRISVAVDGACALYLGDQLLAGTPGAELEAVLQQLGEIGHDYAGISVPARGIEATRWKHSDTFYYMVAVFPPRTTRSSA